MLTKAICVRLPLNVEGGENHHVIGSFTVAFCNPHARISKMLLSVPQHRNKII